MVDTSVPEHEEDVGPSRSERRAARKDEKARLEALGVRLTTLTARAFESLDLGEAVEREVSLLATLGSGSALARQRRRVAGLLRALDIDELERSVERAAGAAGTSPTSTYRLERLRRDLLEGDEEVLSRLFDAHPRLDRQRLKQAVRAARREAQEGPAGRRFKDLFQLLKELGLGEG